MPHLAVVAFNLISIILVLIFARFRLEGRLAKVVSLVLDALIILLLLGLIFVCFRFSSL
jgi:preprotein translocase subunit SecF